MCVSVRAMIVKLFLDACPNDCNGHGECRMNQCICRANWFGPECQFTIENNCNDQLDNDNGEDLSLKV